VRQVLPLLLAGVFVVGVIGRLIPREFVETYLGGSSLTSSFLATLIGAVSYFATMTGAPFVKTLITLGMGKGPTLGLLLAGPGESLPNWLAISRVFGLGKAAVYVATTIVISTITAYIAGNTIWRQQPPRSLASAGVNGWVSEPSRESMAREFMSEKTKTCIEPC
jgi:uncharacterized membrane protein YraQ (UPF0718 family)